MNKKLIIGVLVYGLFLGCKDQEQVELPEPTDSNAVYDLPHIELVQQSDVAENATSQWSVFDEFTSILVSIPGSNIERIRTQSDRLTRYSDSLMKHIPDNLITMPIQNRLDVIHARMNLLQQSSEHIVVDSQKLKENYRESVLAFNALLHQINEKFARDAIQQLEEGNFSTEIQQRFRDSVFEIEKRKQK